MHTKKIKSPRLRADEVAAILNCAKSTVWKWAKEGRIPARIRKATASRTGFAPKWKPLPAARI